MNLKSINSHNFVSNSYRYNVTVTIQLFSLLPEKSENQKNMKKKLR